MKEITEELLNEHRLIAIHLKELKEREKQLRIEIVDIYESMGKNELGTHYLQCNKLNVKMVLKTSMKIDEQVLNTIYDSLTTLEKDCIKTEHSIVKAEYEELPMDNPILDDALIVTDAMPTLIVTLVEE